MLKNTHRRKLYQNKDQFISMCIENEIGYVKSMSLGINDKIGRKDIMDLHSLKKIIRKNMEK